jgi:hypothetical protein
MREKLCRNSSMARKLKIMGKEKHTMSDLKYGKETLQNLENEKGTMEELIMARNQEMWKTREKHFRTWTVARKVKMMENEKHKL